MLLDVQGKQAYCYTGGKVFDAALPAIVLVHGAQNDHSVWGLQSRYLAHHGHAVLVPDLPGHGRSAGPALTSVEAMADWLLALLDAAGVQRAILGGHSMGSLIALEAAHRAPAKAAGLALLGTAYPMKVSDALLETSRSNEEAAIDMVNIFSHSSMAHKPSCPGPGFSVMGGAQPRAAFLHGLRRLQQLRQRRSGGRRHRLPGPVHPGQQGHDDAGAFRETADRRSQAWQNRHRGSRPFPDDRSARRGAGRTRRVCGLRLRDLKRNEEIPP